MRIRSREAALFSLIRNSPLGLAKAAFKGERVISLPATCRAPFGQVSPVARLGVLLSAIERAHAQFRLWIRECGLVQAGQCHAALSGRIASSVRRHECSKPVERGNEEFVHGLRLIKLAAKYHECVKRRSGLALPILVELLELPAWPALSEADGLLAAV